MLENILSKIQKDKEDFIKYILRYQHENKQGELVIYGAGSYAKKLFHLLKAHHISIKCFCVSDSTFNINLIENTSVVEVSSLSKSGGQFLFLIAAKAPTDQAIIDGLKKYGFDRYLTLPNHFDKMTDDVFFDRF